MITIKCINTGGYYLTLNKIYQAILSKEDSKLIPNHQIISYKLINDKGVEFYSETSNFIEIKKWRENQLNKILLYNSENTEKKILESRQRRP
jgi:phosphomevalonate kinase